MKIFKFEITIKEFIRFIITALIYTLWVIWVGSFWLIIGLGVIFDIYISKKVNWSPWKKRHGKNSKIIEWLDALIFAVIAVTIINIFLFQNYRIPTGSMEKSLLIGDHLYVSKAAYGPRIPNTPLSFPFAQHTMPLTRKTKSYLEWIKWPYKRLAGFSEIKRNDVVVFNFPAGDTVCIEQQNVSYYSIIREYAEKLKQRDFYNSEVLKSKDEYYREARLIVLDRYDIVIRPVDKKDNYIKRCVAIPGDTLQIINSKVIVNGKEQEYIKGVQLEYKVFLAADNLPHRKILDKLNLEIKFNPYRGYYIGNYTKNEIEKLLSLPEIKDVVLEQQYIPGFNIFPHDERYNWDLDHFGPIYIPEKGKTINLNVNNLPFYKRIIDHYENNDVEVKDSKIYINGKETNIYTFQMNYYWMMGDNRHSSLDSRYWGYVPEDHIIGKPKIVWLSLNKEKSGLGRIRWERMLIGIK